MAAENKVKTGLIVFFLVEFSILLISLLLPITPSKTGSKGDLAEWFIQDPAYIEKVVVYFIFTHVVFILLALIFFIWVKLSPKSSVPGEEQ